MTSSSPSPILRIWHGRTARSRADEYARFLLARAVPDYRSVPGNLEVRIARRDVGEVTHFLAITRWANESAVRAFAGESPTVAKYYPEDRDFLLELEPQVVHYSLLEPATPALPARRNPQEDVVLLGLCGSLRASSTNRALLEAGARLARERPGGVSVRLEIFDRIAELPPFDPDAVAGNSPAVAALSAAVRRADGLVVSSPEYARGVPGALKNALDWLVGGDAFVAKPFALWSASPRSARAQEALAETLRTMSGIEVSAAGLTLSLVGKRVSPESLVADEASAAELRRALTAFARGFPAALGASPEDPAGAP